MAESSLDLQMIEWLKHQYADVQQLVDLACQKVNRCAAEVRVVAVTKYIDESIIPLLWQAGLCNFGENRWQQAEPKLEVPLLGHPTWHFIGRLQQNKVSRVVRHFEWIHSVDSLELLRAIDRESEKSERFISCLLQVNVSGEETKQGLEPEQVLEVARSALSLRNARVRGLMTMAPFVEDVESVRPVFRRLRELRDEIGRELGEADFTQLSMGMSEDFPVAVEEGATMVRVGRRLVVRQSEE